MKRFAVFLGLLVWHATSFAEQAGSSNSASKTIINQVMDDFHDAADKGDKARYLGHFADTGVFMGTDSWERWPLAEFTEYVDKRFKDGKGWSYKPLQRHIAISPSGETAWFDEITFSEKWGRFRGTGVLIKDQKSWKIAHYSMSMLIPNEAWEEISKIATETYNRVESSKP